MKNVKPEDSKCLATLSWLGKKKWREKSINDYFSRASIFCMFREATNCSLQPMKVWMFKIALFWKI